MKKILIMLLMLAVVFALSACGGGGEIRSLSDLERDGIIIGVQNGTTGHIFADDNFPNAEVSAFPLFTDAVMALLAGSIDAVIVDYVAALEFAAEHPERLTLLDGVLTSEYYGIAFPLGSPLTERFNYAMNILRENSTMDQLYEYWITSVMTGSPGPGGARYVSPPDIEHPNGVLRMGTSAGFPPFEMWEGDRIVGFDPCMAQAIGDILGYQIEIVDMAFAAIILAVQTGDVDFGMAGMTITDVRREEVDFSQGYFASGQRVLVRRPGADVMDADEIAALAEEGEADDEGDGE